MALKPKESRVSFSVQLIFDCHWLVCVRGVGLTDRPIDSAGMRSAKRLLKGNCGALNTLFWWRKCWNYGCWEGHYLCSFWRIVGVWWNRYNTCLKRQNTLNVTVTAFAVQNKREHPSRVKGFVETVVPNYCDPTFASHFRMKIHFRRRIMHFLPPRLCYDLYDIIEHIEF